MPTKQEVGERLRLARFKRDMTLKDVAARSGMSATHISEIERGKTSPTIGALQKISKALGERSAHFVEEKSICQASLVRRGERVRQFTVGSEGETIDFEQLTQPCPWSTTHLTHKTSEAGEILHRPPVLGELVIVCMAGMYRLTIGDESHVIREGDTIQFFLDDGYAIEDISDDGSELVAVGAYEARVAW
jgi:XRE family transcriptional regulator, regulator of sulfur utilization